jgi:hypothetical protein
MPPNGKRLPAAPQRTRILIDDAFWLRYLRAHADPRTRRLHAAGTTAATALVAAAVARRSVRFTAAALVCGYGPAWFAHAVIERNRPETFRAPLRSLAADYRMWWSMMRGTLAHELQRAHATAADTSRT